MSKGHTIPIIHLAHLLLRRQISVTVFTTPTNHDFMSSSLPASSATSILELSFLHDIPGIPTVVESTDKLPSMSLFPQFALSTESIRPQFNSALENLSPRPTFMVSDGFLWWTQDSAKKFGIPRPSTACPTTHLLRRGRWGGRWRRLAFRRRRTSRCRSRKSCGGVGRRFGWSELGFFLIF
ncbi:UDP-glycosyltransferase 90A1 [Linum perenne]